MVRHRLKNKHWIMNSMRPLVFWLIVFAAFAAMIVLLHGVLLPFVAGIVLAYLLDPLANRVVRLGLSRLLATLVITFLALGTIVALLFLVAPIIVRELTDFIERLPHYVERLHALTNDPHHPWVSKIFAEGLGEAEHSIDDFSTQASAWIDTFLRSIWSGGRALISILSLVLVTPIIACYLLYHWNAVIAASNRLVPPVHRQTFRALAGEIDKTIGGFVRGQSALCLILALFYAGALYAIGLDHGVLIGCAAGVISFIPYLGALSGLVVSTAIAVAQFWPNWTLMSLVPVIFFIGQSLGDYVLSPYLVGRRVHLNPVWVIFALFALGYLFGFVGLLIAVPIAAAMGVLIRFALQQYFASSFYLTASPPSPPEMPTDRGSRQ